MLSDLVFLTCEKVVERYKKVVTWYTYFKVT